MEAALMGVVANSAMGLSPKRHLRERNLGKIATSDTRINQRGKKTSVRKFDEYGDMMTLIIVMSRDGRRDLDDLDHRDVT
uniref:Uncharacterized protein n=1 Tax=Oryza sativa subsp. japonica TaxID=39947 RepID=Q6YVM8_ORYSJ|nr:hypothetical protein [Oryza sativa Japonica Group]